MKKFLFITTIFLIVAYFGISYTIGSSGLDKLKDQSYMLWQINKKFLEKTILPLGGLKKEEVRKIAKEYELENANRSESMDLCFVVDNDYGEVVGSHNGYTNYTIGQRRGLGLSFPEPRYVKKILPNDNKIIVSKRDGLLSDKCYVSNLNWMKDINKFPFKSKARIRYNSQGVDTTITKKNNKYYCQFEQPQLAVTPGQSIVFYVNDSVVGGGIIE